MSSTNAIAELIRRAAVPGIWSRGVKLARGSAVTCESRADDEIVLRVKTPGLTVAPTVVLYPVPGEEEWDCDCEGRMRPCEHIVAAAIALSQEGPEGTTVTTAAEAAGRIEYRLAREEHGLRLERVIVLAEGEEKPVEPSLAALLAMPAEARRLSPEEPDLRADLLLDRRRSGVLPGDKLQALLIILAGSSRVTLDGRPVIVSSDAVSPRAVIADDGDGIVLRIEADPAVTVVSAGVGLRQESSEEGSPRSLHLLTETELTGPYLRNLPVVRRFSPAEFGDLGAKTLPDLDNRMPVQLLSKRLPRTDRALTPRIKIDLAQLQGHLSVLATLVYGDPACARIDDGRLVHLGGPVPVRDEAAEKKLLLRLREDLSLLPGRRMTFTGPDGAKFASALSRWQGSLEGEAAATVAARYDLVPRLSVTSDDTAGVRMGLVFDALPAAGGDTRAITALAVISAWREGLGLVPLEGGGFAPLPLAWLAQHGQKVADLLAARDAAGRIATHALPELASLCDTLETPRPPALDRLTPLLADFDGLPAAPLPADLTVTLRAYQRRAADWLSFLRRAGLGAVLADDMGLGKTLEALAVLDGPSLVVAPTSVLFNWHAEAQRFRPGLSVNVYHGPARSLEAPADLTLTTYAVLRLDAGALSARSWKTIVLDEAQAIKNPDSQSARAAFDLHGDFRIALTGTPIENRLEELWSLLHFTNRGLLGGKSDFQSRFARPIAEGDAAALANLRRKVKPFVLRRLKQEVAPELPPRTEAVLRVELEPAERAVYDTVAAASRKDVLALLADGGGSRVLAVLEALLRLRQAACHPALVPGQHADGSSKVKLLVETLDEVASEGHKALVFSQWTSMLDLIEPHLLQAGIAFERLDGSTRDRQGVVTRFQDDGGPPVMLVSLKAGGTGLNLTAADHVFLCDPWWNPAVEAQAADRTHRIGQDKPVFVYRLVAADTVEERILALQARKRSLGDAALGDAGAAAGLTREDLLDLLG
jgi:superfamily II DNA or RNA helicase